MAIGGFSRSLSGMGSRVGGIALRDERRKFNVQPNAKKIYQSGLQFSCRLV
jgi:hypothetical protein